MFTTKAYRIQRLEIGECKIETLTLILSHDRERRKAGMILSFQSA